MKTDFLRYYDRELRFIRELAAEFAEDHPRVASSLKLSADTVADPHVERLIEAFALMNARTQMRLDDGFPELVEGLLNVLYPHYLEPVPSTAIVHFTVAEDAPIRAKARAGTMIETEAAEGATCLYRLAHDVHLDPVKLCHAELMSAPFEAPSIDATEGAQGCLKLVLETMADDVDFTKVGLDKLRIYLGDEQRTANTLYELLLNNVVCIAVADSKADTAATILPASRITPAGLAPEEALYRQEGGAGEDSELSLMTEYFIFPEKFRFLDLEGLASRTLLGVGSRLEVYVFLDEVPSGLERRVNARSFRLNCGPAVNTFKAQAEPIRLDHSQTEYRLIVDARREDATEVLRIDKVVLSQTNGDQIICVPTLELDGRERAQVVMWQAHRRDSRAVGEGDDVCVSIASEKYGPELLEDAVISVDVTCTNRNIPSALPFGGGRPTLTLSDDVPGVAAAEFLTVPTVTVRPSRGAEAHWRLVSQLAINNLPLVGDDGGTDTLREMLLIHNLSEDNETRRMVGRLREIAASSTTVRAPGGGRISFVSGLSINLQVDDERFSGSGLFTLLVILNRYFARYAALNTASELKVTLWKDKKTLVQFAPRAGTMPIL